MLHSSEDKCNVVQLPEGVTPFTHITQNEFLGRKHKKLKEDDIAICECKYDASDPESVCVERCLNVITNTECTPGYCPCGETCRNQAGQFIIEYCGEVISSEEAKKRSQAYEAHGLKDAYIISLDANYFIDATRKGSFARFINHSCCPNCETRKWQVLGETRVGIFAKQDIFAGMELAYDYNFEWYGGATVHCLCGSANCSIFLGAKSQGFQEYNHVWEDGDDRYTVEEVPLYDSAEDESLPVIPGTSGGNEQTKILTDSEGSTFKLEPSNSTVMNYNIGSGSTPKKKSQRIPKRKVKSSSRKQANDGDFAKLFASKEAREEVTKYEGLRNEATSKLNAVYEEIRPTIEEHGRDNQDSVPTSVAETWIEAHCDKYKADFDLYFSVIKNMMCPRPASYTAAAGPSEGGAGPQTTNAVAKLPEGGAK